MFIGNPKQKKQPIARHNQHIAYLFLFPSLAVFMVFIIYPIGFSLWSSFTNWSLIQSAEYVGWANYVRLWKDQRFWNAVYNTVVYTVGVVPIGTMLSLALAVALNQNLKGTKFFRTAIFLPVVASTAIIAIVWTFLFDPQIGLFVYYLSKIRITMGAWLRDPDYAMLAIIIVSIWKNVGFNMVIFLAGLQGIPYSLYEAAKVDGANRLQMFRYVTLPQLRPTTAFVIVMSVLGSFQVFDQIYVMTRGGPLYSTETLVQYIYHHGFVTFQMSYGATIAMFLLVVILALTIFQLRLFDRPID